MFIYACSAGREHVIKWSYFVDCTFSDVSLALLQPRLQSRRRQANKDYPAVQLIKKLQNRK